MEHLPTEILMKILSFLRPLDLFHMGKVCSKIEFVTNNHEL